MQCEFHRIKVLANSSPVNVEVVNAVAIAAAMWMVSVAVAQSLGMLVPAAATAILATVCLACVVNGR